MLSKLSLKVMDESRKEVLRKKYQHEIDAAKFWATYPMGVSVLNKHEKYKLLTKIKHLNE